MYSTIDTYLKTLITTVNSGITGTTNDFKEVDSFIDGDNLPANLMDKTFQIKLDTVEDKNYEAPYYEISAVIDLWFMTANNRGNYTTAIDTYIRPLVKQLKYSHGYKGTTFSISGIEDVKVNGLNKFSGNFFNPSITLTLKCIDAL